MPEQPSLELIVYKLTQLEISIERYHTEVERRFDKKDAERAALAVRIAALETWRTERTTKLELEEKRNSRRDGAAWGVYTSIILLMIKTAWDFLTTQRL